MPPKKYKSLTVSIEIYNELEKIKREKNFDSFNDVIKDLIRKYSPTVNIEDLVNKICDASKIDRNLYLIDCNGRKAIVPEKMIKVISENFNIIIRLKD